MSRFIAQRVAESLLVLVIMSFVIYGLIGLMPGDPIDVMVSSDPDLTHTGSISRSWCATGAG
jgi:peptide/nickel transport system permease protein